jgi:hypothetical protein
MVLLTGSSGLSGTVGNPPGILFISVSIFKLKSHSNQIKTIKNA